MFANRTYGFHAMFRRSQGVRVRSTIVATIIVALGMVAGAVIMLYMLHRHQDSQMYRSTGTRSYEIAHQINEGGINSIDSELLRPTTGIDVIQIVDDNGVVLFSSPGSDTVAVSDIRPGWWNTERVDGVELPGRSGTYCGQITGARFDGIDYNVITAVSTQPYFSGLWGTAAILPIEIPLIIVIAGAGIYYFVGRALKPVARITTQVSAITSSDLSRRVPVPSTDDELTTLAVTMNDMLDRLETSRVSQLQFVGDASHELRSPLTTLVGLLDLADDTDSPIDVDTVRTILLPEAQRMSSMVADLLLLARADERGIPLTVDEVDLDDIVGAEVKRLRSLGAAKVVARVSPVRVIGDSGKLTRAIRNLTDNAAHHASSSITIEMGWDESVATIRVIDDGPGVPEDLRAKIFDRFYRHESDRGRHQSGSGLGLPIAAEIAKAHGGAITVSQAPGGGASFAMTIRTPVAAPRDDALSYSSTRQ
ncbi:HAMP domain-containing sensor histidine kinase [Williamsia sp. 1135]|uniref:sensor histidine kinase n=1 Tax=Williamsia sp. 1135 TaxID=1889262 RepID=UPI000A100E7B|nr:HAMP domain-containing sensor histidine kinase [Williamsia sp. 1135]ORM30173.1 two-component sensor histidine kinase [Williamsia sp. 1135]